MTACQATAFFGVDCFHEGAAMSGEITSPQNRRVKDAAKLRGRRQRTKQARIIIDGTQKFAKRLTRTSILKNCSAVDR